MRTKPPPYYIQPAPHEIEDAANALDIKKYPSELIADMSNIAAGGEIVPSAKWRHKVARNIGPGPKDRDGDYHYYDLNQEVTQLTKDPAEAERHRINLRVREHENTQEFIKNIDFDEVPGMSPLEQSLTIFKMLTQQQNQPEGNDDEIPKSLENDSSEDNTGKSQAGKFNKIFENLRNMSDAERELLQLEDHRGSGKGNDPDAHLKQAQLAADMLKGKHIWMEISRKLDKIVKMRTPKSNKVEPDPEGDDIQHRPIQGFHEIHKLPPAEYAYPESIRMYRIATQQTQIRERVMRTDQVQLLYMIVDCSGSMGGDKIHKAGGILMNRLKAVIKEEAVVYARFFDTRLFTEHLADSPETAKELIKHFNAENFNGGGTDITGCVKESVKRIEELMQEDPLLVRPELVVVTDGEDSVSLRKSDFGKTRMHSFLVNAYNDELTHIARETGGVGISI